MARPTNSKSEIGNWLRPTRGVGSQQPNSSFQFQVSSFLPPRCGWVALTLVAFTVLGLPSEAAAQGCAMCYQSASAAKQAGIQALENGVLILLLPPLLIFAAILWRTFWGQGREEFDVVDFDEEFGARRFGPIPEFSGRVPTSEILTESREPHKFRSRESGRSSGS